MRTLRRFQPTVDWMPTRIAPSSGAIGQTLVALPANPVQSVSVGSFHPLTCETDPTDPTDPPTDPILPIVDPTSPSDPPTGQ